MRKIEELREQEAQDSIRDYTISDDLSHFRYISQNPNSNSVDECICGECVCDDTGIYYLCPTCGKRYASDLDAMMCCFPDQQC